MRLKTFFAMLAVMIIGSTQAQGKWNLLKCVQFAMDSNLTIKQTALQEQFSQLTLKQSKLSQIPNLSFGGNAGFSSGRNQDPTTFSLITQSYFSSGFQLQSSAEIFNWFSKKNTIAANEWELLAAKANTDKLKNDIALAVCNFYLQSLLAQEQVQITQVQLTQSQAQYGNTRKMVDAGALPELNASELETQVARDSANVISAKGALAINLLSLKAYMGLDADRPFDIETPPVESIPLLPMAELMPDVVYTSAITNLPQQRYNDFNMKAAEKRSAAAKGALYPTLSAYGNFNTAFNSRATEITGLTFTTPAIGTVTVGGTPYTVFSADPFPRYSYGKTAYFSQLNQNFRQSIGLSLNVPIFNSWTARAGYERSKLNIKNLQFQQLIDNQKLKQDIYTAYNNALVALEKFNAGKKALETATRSYDFARKRYEVGMSSTIELITNQNNLFTQQLQNVLNQFDYVFKMKVLEFYKGQGLKL